MEHTTEVEATGLSPDVHAQLEQYVATLAGAVQPFVVLVERARDTAADLEGRLEQALRHLEATLPLAQFTWAQDGVIVQAASDWVAEQRLAQ